MRRKLWKLLLEPPLPSLDSVKKLIDQGRWIKARQILRDPSFEQRHGGGASTAKERNEEVWVQYCFYRALVELLTSDDSNGVAERYHNYAKESPAYTPELEGDFTRDVALACIRAGRLKKAQALIEEAALNHQTPNRKTLMESVRARWNVEAGNPEEAEEGFKKAHKQWAEMGTDADEQWVRNSLYHWFKFRASRGHIDSEMAAQIRNNDPSLPRKFSVWLICSAVTLANRLDNSLQRLALWLLRF